MAEQRRRHRCDRLLRPVRLPDHEPAASIQRERRGGSTSSRSIADVSSASGRRLIGVLVFALALGRGSRAGVRGRALAARHRVQPRLRLELGRGRQRQHRPARAHVVARDRGTVLPGLARAVADLLRGRALLFAIVAIVVGSPDPASLRPDRSSTSPPPPASTRSLLGASWRSSGPSGRLGSLSPGWPRSSRSRSGSESRHRASRSRSSRPLP